MQIVLVEPEIPPNTGNVARLCAATGAKLHLVGPLGFRLDDKQLKRAGMDYWELVDWKVWADWKSFSEAMPGGSRKWYIECGAPRNYAQVSYQIGDYLVFGRETAGLPQSWLREVPAQWVGIPMNNPGARSLNLSNCVAIVLFEALRQIDFRGAKESMGLPIPPDS